MARELSPSRPERPPRERPNSRNHHRDATIVLATIAPAADSALPSTLPMLCRNIAGPSSSDLPCCSPLEDGWSRNGKPEHQSPRPPLRSPALRRTSIVQPFVQPPRRQHLRPALRPQDHRCCSKRLKKNFSNSR